MLFVSVFLLKSIRKELHENISHAQYFPKYEGHDIELHVTWDPCGKYGVNMGSKRHQVQSLKPKGNKNMQSNGG